MRALSLGSWPISRIQDFAKSRGEYHKKPTTIVDRPATRTASQFKLCMCMNEFLRLAMRGKQWAVSYDAHCLVAKQIRREPPSGLDAACGPASRLFDHLCPEFQS